MLFAYQLSSTSASISSTQKKLTVLVDKFEISSIIYNYEKLSQFSFKHLILIRIKTIENYTEQGKTKTNEILL